MNRIFLLFPNFKLYNFWNLTPHQPPLSLGYLAAMLEKIKCPFVVCDASAENLSHKKIIKKINEFNPTIVGITTNIALAYSTTIQAKLIRENFPNIKIIMGGPWATINYEIILKTKLCDIVCLGESEHTITKIAECDLNNIDLLQEIRSIAFVNNNQIIKTKPLDNIADLNTLPFPSWKYFPINKYSTIHRDKPYFPILTTRGCPYDCLNCTKIIHGYKIRYRSVENVIKELDYLKENFNAKEIIIADDMFNLDLKRAKFLLKEIIKRKYNFKIQLPNGIRADFVDEEFAKLLSQAGTYKVAIGVESGSQKVIEFLHKRLDLNVLPKTVSILKKFHMSVHGYFILGLPPETKNSIIYSIDFADKIGLDVANFFDVLIFKGIKLYDYVRPFHIKFENLESFHSINYRMNPYIFAKSNLTKKDLMKAKTYTIIRFYLNPRKFFNLLKTHSFLELIYFSKSLFNLILAYITNFIQKKNNGIN